MAVPQSSDLRSLFRQPHELLTMVYAFQREFPDTPRFRIAEVLYEGRDNPVVSTMGGLKAYVSARLHTCGS